MWFEIAPLYGDLGLLSSRGAPPPADILRRAKHKRSTPKGALSLSQSHVVLVSSRRRSHLTHRVETEYTNNSELDEQQRTMASKPKNKHAASSASPLLVAAPSVPAK